MADFDTIFRQVDTLLGPTNVDPITPTTTFAAMGFTNNSLNIFVQGSVATYFGVPLPAFNASANVRKLVLAIQASQQTQGVAAVAAMGGGGGKKKKKGGK